MYRASERKAAPKASLKDVISNNLIGVVVGPQHARKLPRLSSSLIKAILRLTSRIHWQYGMYCGSRTVPSHIISAFDENLYDLDTRFVLETNFTTVQYDHDDVKA